MPISWPLPFKGLLSRSMRYSLSWFFFSVSVTTYLLVNSCAFACTQVYEWVIMSVQGLSFVRVFFFFFEQKFVWQVERFWVSRGQKLKRQGLDVTVYFRKSQQFYFFIGIGFRGPPSPSLLPPVQVAGTGRVQFRRVPRCKRCAPTGSGHGVANDRTEAGGCRGEGGES